MAEKTLKTRIIQKHDTEVNWSKATNFIPKLGEVIIYDPDTTHTASRIKVGDGKTVVSSLPWAKNDFDSSMSSTSENAVQNKVVKSELDTVKSALDEKQNDLNLKNLDDSNSTMITLNPKNSNVNSIYIAQSSSTNPTNYESYLYLNNDFVKVGCPNNHIWISDSDITIGNYFIDEPTYLCGVKTPEDDTMTNLAANVEYVLNKTDSKQDKFAKVSNPDSNSVLITTLKNNVSLYNSNHTFGLTAASNGNTILSGSGTSLTIGSKQVRLSNVGATINALNLVGIATPISAEDSTLGITEKDLPYQAANKQYVDNAVNIFSIVEESDDLVIDTQDIEALDTLPTIVNGVS